MRLTVVRGAGKRQGPDIIDPMLSDEQTALARGRREIDYNSSPRVSEQCQCPLHSFIETGSLARVTESSGRWPGKVTYFARTLTLDESGRFFTADVALHIEREAK